MARSIWEGTVLAESDDGVSWTVRPEPVFALGDDEIQPWIEFLDTTEKSFIR